MDLFSQFCNICLEADTENLQNVCEERMALLKDTLITCTGHGDIINKNAIYLCRLCCEELIRFNKFREKCFSHLIELRQMYSNIKSKLELEEDAVTVILREVLRAEVLRCKSGRKSNSTEEFIAINNNDDCVDSPIEMLHETSEKQDSNSENVENSPSEDLQFDASHMNASNSNDTIQIEFEQEELDTKTKMENSASEQFDLKYFVYELPENENFVVDMSDVNIGNGCRTSQIQLSKETPRMQNNSSGNIKLEEVQSVLDKGVFPKEKLHTEIDIENSISDDFELNDVSDSSEDFDSVSNMNSSFSNIEFTEEELQKEQENFISNVKESVNGDISGKENAKAGIKSSREGQKTIRDPYPRRNIPERNYAEESNIPADHYVYCDFCQEDFLMGCPTHNLTIIMDERIPLSKDRAIRTAPKKWVKVLPSKIPNAGLGVCSVTGIPKGFRFGPYEGQLCSNDSDSKYCWQIRDEKHIRFLDGEDTKISNWLRYVNCARNHNEQNMALYQFKGKIYYRSVVDIPADSELLVFYGRQYALQLQIDMQNYFSQPELALHDNVFRCSWCYLAFKTPNALQEHVSRCNYKTPPASQASLPAPRQIDNVDNNGALYKCEICSDKIYTLRSLYVSHMKIKHQILPGAVRTLADVDGSIGDIENNTFAGKENNEETCNRRQADVQRKRPHMCQHCHKQFPTQWLLTRHMRTHTGDRPYKCTICDKAFTTNSNLHTHARTHTGDRRYKCTICDKAFTQPGALHTHARTHTNERPYKCNVCEKSFTLNGNLTTHQRIHTNTRPYKCTQCSKTFTQSSKLTRHMRVHTGQRPYKCTVCDMAFTQSGDLTSHMRLHTGQRPYKCTVCDKAFTHSSHLTRHKRTHGNTLTKPTR